MVARMRSSPVVFRYDFEKALAAILYFASQPDRVTFFDKKKAFSLIFLADLRYLLRYGEPIFGDDYAALPYGAVPQQTWRRLNRITKPRGRDVERLAEALIVENVPDHDFPVLRARIAPDMDFLSQLEVAALDEVAATHGRKTFKELWDLIHPAAWHKARKAEPRNITAPMMRYEDLFEGHPEAEPALRRMIEDHRLRRALSGL